MLTSGPQEWRGKSAFYPELYQFLIHTRYIILPGSQSLLLFWEIERMGTYCVPMRAQLSSIIESTLSSLNWRGREKKSSPLDLKGRIFLSLGPSNFFWNGWVYFWWSQGTSPLTSLWLRRAVVRCWLAWCGMRGERRWLGIEGWLGILQGL